MSDNNPTSHPYQKLGGWLLLFVVGEIVYLPIAIALQFGQGGIVGSVRAMLASAAVDLLALFIQLVSLFILAAGIACLVLIIKRDARFLRVYELSCAGAAVSILCQIASLFKMSWADPMEAGVAIFIVAFAAFSLVGGVLLRYAYYTRSVRVRTYMGSDEYLRLGVFSKKIKGPEPAAPDAAE